MKILKQHSTEVKETSPKYKRGEFGYWWTNILEREDIEGKVYKGDIWCTSQKLISLKGCPKEVKGDFDCSHNKLTSLKEAPKKLVKILIVVIIN